MTRFIFSDDGADCDANAPCNGVGQCSDAANYVQCTCPAGMAGSKCELCKYL